MSSVEFIGLDGDKKEMTPVCGGTRGGIPHDTRGNGLIAIFAKLARTFNYIECNLRAGERHRWREGF